MSVDLCLISAYGQASPCLAAFRFRSAAGAGGATRVDRSDVSRTAMSGSRRDTSIGAGVISRTSPGVRQVPDQVNDLLLQVQLSEKPSPARTSQDEKLRNEIMQRHQAGTPMRRIARELIGTHDGAPRAYLHPAGAFGPLPTEWWPKPAAAEPAG